jgi:hypothetical protein
MFKNLAALLVLFTAVLINSPALAQMQGVESNDSSKEEQQMDSEGEQMEEQREEKEEKLERTLEIEKEQKTDVQEVPGVPESLNNNVPESPEQEVEVQF